MSEQNKVLVRRAVEEVQDATPMAGGQGFVGSWQLTISPVQGTPAVGLATFGAEGALVTSVLPVEPSPGAPGGVVFVSAGHGAWEATGPDTATFTFVALGANGQGIPDGTGTIRASIALGPDGQTFSGEYVATMADPAGNTVATEQGTVPAKRIVAEAPGLPTPAA
jgi:hypothetical protein